MLKLILTGMLAGGVNGLFGAGGGVLCVLGLERMCGMEKKSAHATTVSVILVLSVISLFAYFKNGFVDTKTAVFACLGGVVGGHLGARLLNRLSPKYIGKIFGALMIISSIGMFFR